MGQFCTPHYDDTSLGQSPAVKKFCIRYNSQGADINDNGAMCKELDDLETQWQKAKNNEQLLLDPISSAIKDEQPEFSQFLPKFFAFLMASEEATDGHSNLAEAGMDVSQMVKTMLKRGMETVHF
jgi:hypothetical protein